MKYVCALFFLLSASYLVAQEDVIVHDFASLSPHLAHQNDTVYIVNFWATWCKPCVAELPHFESLTENFADQPVKVLLVSLDFENQIESKLKPFLAEHQLHSEVVMLYERNPNDWIDQVDPSWSGAIPATLIWQNDKRKFIEGSFENYNQLEDIILSYIKI